EQRVHLVRTTALGQHALILREAAAAIEAGPVPDRVERIEERLGMQAAGSRLRRVRGIEHAVEGPSDQAAPHSRRAGERHRRTRPPAGRPSRRLIGAGPAATDQYATPKSVAT